MQGAKGVIISIIGGDDMKLLEVDEAANHIRELVDPNANIIWGSAFNPDLQGKIRVSVVATGIEQSASQAEEAGRPFNLSASRGPVRPQTETAQPLFGRSAPAPVPEPEPVAEAAPAPEPEPEVAIEAPAPVASYSDDDAWDAAPAASEAAATEAAEDEPLELEMEAEEPAPAPAPAAEPADDLLSNASRLVEEDQPVAGGLPGRRRGLVSSDSGEGGDAGEGDGDGDPSIQPAAKTPRVSTGGATLFERMANLSRGGRSKDEDEDEDDGDGPSISIPRFLGRQNNQ